MASTNLVVNLTTAMRAQFGARDVYFQILVFGNNGDAPLWQSGAIRGSELAASYTAEITKTAPTISGGKAYFILQSSVDGTAVSIASQSEINWTSAQKYNYRFDSFEFSLLNSPTDAANLTSVEGFGFGMKLEVPATGSRGYDNSAHHFFSDYLKSIGVGGHSTLDYFKGGPLDGQVRGAVSPTTSVAQPAGAPGAGVFAPEQWNKYIASLETVSSSETVAVVRPVSITGYFNGGQDANGVYHNAAFYSYTLEWDKARGAFWLNPESNSQVQGHLLITPDQLANSIYSTLGSVQIYAHKTDAAPYQILNNGGADMNVGANNQWGAVLAHFLIGFTAGYFGVVGKSPNSAVDRGADLNANWNWDPTYAFGQNLYGGQKPIFMDPYSQVFFGHSNSYGSAYSDALMNAYAAGGPLLPVWAAGQNVPSINVTLYGDQEKPGGYTKPVIYNYIPVPAQQTDYGIPTATEGNTGTPRSIVLSFTNGAVQLADKVPVKLEIYGGKDAAGAPTWTTADFGTPDSLWTTWNFVLDSNNNYVKNADGSYQVQADPNAKPTPGSMTFAFLPTIESGVSWYRVIVGEDRSPAQKVFNFYTTTDNYVFQTSAGALAVDGLATVTANPTTPNTFSLSFFNGSTSSLDPRLLKQVANMTYSGATPNAPVAGLLQDGTFTALDGQASQVSNSLVLKNGEVAFGWTGDNSNVNVPSWISGITNKVGGLNIALLSFSAGQIAPLAVQADVDGQWTSSVMQTLGNGTYQVTSREYAFSDKAFSTPLAAASSPLSLTVNLSKLGLEEGSSGLRLVDDHSGTRGNWISLDTIASAMPSDTTLILYRTNGAGQMVAGNGDIVSSVKDAALAYVGSAKSDGGATLFNGQQMVFLGLGQELHFAVQTGAKAIDLSPHVSTSMDVSGALGVSVAGIQLRAKTDNDLDAADNMASVQRMYDLPMVFLSHGQTLDVQVAGSAANTNQLHFVRFDLDFASHSLSVDGVAYGDTAAFRAAVLKSFDAGYATSNGGGNFSSSAAWTVNGKDGYYAPVLITQSGDIFVPGTANSGGADYIRMFGQNVFGFEDLTAAQGSDFDYNDMVMRLVPHI